MAKRPDDGTVTIASNRSVRHNWAIEDTFEAGIVLRGSEVKALRESKAQIAESFAQIRDGELWLHNLHIAPYSHSQRHSGHEPLRVRKLLLHRRELDRIALRMQQERLSLLPMRIYFKEGKAKIEIGVGKPKRKVDKRQDMAKRQAERAPAREIGRAAKQGW
jgi:SsrA-binding protein